VELAALVKTGGVLDDAWYFVNCK